MPLLGDIQRVTGLVDFCWLTASLASPSLIFFAKLLLITLSAGLGSLVYAHGGGLDANGCHTNRKTGEYHCHGGAGSAPSKLPANPQSKPVAPSKSEARPQQPLPPGCFVGPRGGTYTVTKNGKKNYAGC